MGTSASVDVETGNIKKLASYGRDMIEQDLEGILHSVSFALADCKLVKDTPFPKGKEERYTKILQVKINTLKDTNKIYLDCVKNIKSEYDVEFPEIEKRYEVYSSDINKFLKMEKQ